MPGCFESTDSKDKPSSYMFLMSNIFKYLLILSLSGSVLFTQVHSEETSLSVTEDEIEVLDQLIAATDRKAVAQKKLRNVMIDFKKQKERFFKGDQTKKHSFLMVKTASQILRVIQENHLQHLFASDYLEELALFSSIAEKQNPTSP